MTLAAALLLFAGLVVLRGLWPHLLLRSNDRRAKWNSSRVSRRW
jgi:hypothetical protein